MAGGSWYGSPTPSHTMIVTNTPSPDLALTNIAYCSHSDLNKFNVPKTKLYLASVADNSSVLSISAHERITEGHIALNGIQRRNAKVSTGDTVALTRFVPPDDFNLALLTLELAFVSKNANRSEQIDAVLLAQQLRKRFVNQIMTVGQKVPFEYLGTNFVFTVSQAAVEGQEKSKTLERGMISADTYIVFEASKASGIKIVNQREAASSHIFRQKEFNLESLGIGGLSAEFADIFRRAFASRVFPSHVTSK